MADPRGLSPECVLSFLHRCTQVPNWVPSAPLLSLCVVLWPKRQEAGGPSDPLGGKRVGVRPAEAESLPRGLRWALLGVEDGQVCGGEAQVSQAGRLAGPLCVLSPAASPTSFMVEL